MKPCTLVIFSLLFIFISLSSAVTNPAVVDVDGKKLRAGDSYYIIPLTSCNNSSSLALASRNKSNPCPLTVSQQSLDPSRRLPVKFYPVGWEEDDQSVISLSTDLNVEFQVMTVCVQSTVWRLGDFDEGTKHWYVESGGEKGKPGLHTVGNWFKIEKEGDNGYKLVHCPGVCEFCKVICGDLGIFSEDGKMWLGLNNNKPLRVVFKKTD